MDKKPRINYACKTVLLVDSAATSNCSTTPFISEYCLNKVYPEQPLLSTHTASRRKHCDCDTLAFESRFESGNLRRAVRSLGVENVAPSSLLFCVRQIKISETEYDLILSADLNTRGHTQAWPNPT